MSLDVAALPGMELATRHTAGSFDVFRLAANDWAIAVGTLPGPARDTLRATAAEHFPPATALAALDAASAEPATVVLARLELDVCGAWLTLCCAGHPRPVVVRTAGWIDVRGQEGPPVGGDAAPAFADDRIGLGPGDALVFAGHAVTDARGADGEAFAAEALPTALLEAAGRPAADIADHVLAALAAFANAAGPVVVVRVPDDAKEDSIRRVSAATGIPAEELTAPRYPVGEQTLRRRPAPPREARIRLSGEPRSVAGARAFLRRVLASWRMDELLDNGDVELLASELATNAVHHGVSPVTVIARYDGGAVRVEVGDGSREVPAPRDALTTDEGGRGMRLVAALSSAWGTLPTVDGKRVWFEVPAGTPSA